jgi:hypothetical protein
VKRNALSPLSILASLIILIPFADAAGEMLQKGATIFESNAFSG